MPKIETVYLRRFLDPVNEASQVRKEATTAMLSVADLPEKKQAKVLNAFADADRAYQTAVGELVGGLNSLIKDAEAEELALEGGRA